MKALITVGMGYGDEGKGATVDHLVRKFGSGLVIRYSGGAQCAHNVVLPNGTHHTFSQVGSGTFDFADTLLLDKVLVNPISLVQELEHLKKKYYQPQIYVHVNCKITTPYHIAYNRLLEASRGDKKHGSCGLGIGETMDYAQRFEALTLGDFVNRSLVQRKLEEMQQYYRKAANDLDCDYVDEYVRLLESKDSPQELTTFYRNFMKYVNPVGDGEAINLINEEQYPVFEGAQGVLLDENYGFHPHTTWSTTTAKNAHDFLDRVGYKQDRYVLGIMRSYMTRHGAGPLPSEGVLRENYYFDKILNHIPGEHNQMNSWQGQFRSGCLDLRLLEYALKVQPVDGLMITCLDHKLFDYYCTTGRSLVVPSNIAEQEENTKRIKEGSKYGALYSESGDYIDRAAEISKLLRTRCAGFSYGQTHHDRIFID